ncbi:hypothetical protein FACS189475_02060 [Betaproteobacteria bacterium]|nr:hypothetical protein FACS189475_02060 [Betaproteobacteria bacterium]
MWGFVSLTHLYELIRCYWIPACAGMTGMGDDFRTVEPLLCWGSLRSPPIYTRSLGARASRRWFRRAGGTPALLGTIRF